MDHHFEPAPRRCSDLVCRRSAVCRRPSASACPTSHWNGHVRRQRIIEKLRQVLRDSGTDPDGPPAPDALPIEETLKMIREEARKRQAGRRRARAAAAATARRTSA
jgi:hypothetical protein